MYQIKATWTRYYNPKSRTYAANFVKLLDGYCYSTKSEAESAIKKLNSAYITNCRYSIVNIKKN